MCGGAALGLWGRGTTGPMEDPDMDNGNDSADLLTAQYRARPEPFWAGLQARGDDGYERIEVARRWKWEAIPSWGRDGWDLGDWPLVVIFHRDSADGFELAENCEGDVTAYRYPTRALRDAATDAMAFVHWQHRGEPWVAGVADAAHAPAHLRGRFSWNRLENTRPGWALE